MKYPRIPHDKKRSTKLTLKQIEEVRDIYNTTGISLKKLGVLYNVCDNTIRRWVNEKARQIFIIRNIEWQKKQYEDPIYVKHMQSLNRISYKYNRKKYPDKYKEYDNVSHNEYLIKVYGSTANYWKQYNKKRHKK